MVSWWITQALSVRASVGAGGQVEVAELAVADVVAPVLTADLVDVPVLVAQVEAPTAEVTVDGGEVSNTGATGGKIGC